MNVVAAIEDELRDLVPRALAREPAKVIALRTSMSPRHAENLKAGTVTWRQTARFLAMAQQYPELRAAVRRFLALDADLDPEAAQALIDIGLSLVRRRQTALETRQAELESEGADG